MDWQDNEFEGFLKRFRLRESRPLPIAQDVRSVRNPRAHLTKIAAAAVLVVAVGASAAIVRQYAVKQDALKQEPLIVGYDYSVPTAPGSPPPAVVLIPPPPVPATPSVKPDPRPKEPLKQLTKVIPAVETQEAPPLSNPKPGFDIIEVEEDPGRRLFFDACGSCHDAELTASSRFESREEYASLVERMVGRGASVSEPQMPVLLDYLFKTYGERGKATVNAACTGCHAMDVFGVFKGADRSAYRLMVDRMISYGASVPADQVVPLVDYLFRTYGNRGRTP
jgi:cytochrome c5